MIILEKMVYLFAITVVYKFMIKWYTFSLTFAGDMSIAEIKDMLESASVPSLQSKSKWSKQTISNILSNPHYIGDMDYPKIIDPELFDLVQEIKAKRKSSIKS